jgi:hypothetical protein
MDSPNDAPADVTPPRRRPRSRALIIAAGLLLGVVAGLVLMFALFVLKRGQSAPAITREDLAAAEQKWRQRGPKSYNMDLAIGGRQPGPVHIEVRDSRVTRMTRDGVTPSQPRTWEYWTVPEQFETIRQDFDSADTPGGFGAAPGTQTMLKAEFDPQYGYPRRYQRFVLTSKAPSQVPFQEPVANPAATNLDVDWTVTRFEPQP